MTTLTDFERNRLQDQVRELFERIAYKVTLVNDNYPNSHLADAISDMSELETKLKQLGIEL